MLTQAEAILWARKDSWSIDEAALLLSDFSPDRFKKITDYFHRRNGCWRNQEEYLAASRPCKEATDNALPIKQIFESDPPKAFDPATWVSHAEAVGLTVPPVLIEAVKNRGKDREHLQGSAVDANFVTKQQVIDAFAGIHFATDKRWSKALADCPKWLEPCRVMKGKQGDNLGSSTWNPVQIAVALVDKGIPIKKLDAVFVALGDWAGEWCDAAASFRDEHTTSPYGTHTVHLPKTRSKT